MDPRLMKIENEYPAGVVTNYGIGGGQKDFMAQGKGTGTFNSNPAIMK